MKKFGLFIKIYLGFLLTTIAIVGATVYLDHLTGSGPEIWHWQQTVNKTVSFYSSESLRIFDKDGPGALKAFLDRLEKATGIRGFLLDAAGNEISGREMPTDVKKAALSAMVRGSAGTLRDEQFMVGIEKVIGNKGVYTFAALYPRSPHSGPPGFGHPGPPGPPPDARMGHPPIGRMGPPPPLHGPPPGFSPLHFYVRLLIALVISGVACFLLARYLTRPILALGHATRQLADGNLSMRVGYALKSRKDELSELATDFDLMAERIETLLVSQRSLLRDVSHELRSPLARLNVSLELCRSRFGAEGGDLLDRIEREVQRLNDLIGQILTLNRIEMASLNVEKTEINLEVLLEEVAADANYEAGDPRVTILGSAPCILNGNHDLLRRAIENTVRNALYHTPPKSPVEISLRALPANEKGVRIASVTVRDHGKGIPAAELSLIFRPFYKASGEDGSKGGTGLGLAIAEAALRQHGGTITARNAPDGGLIIEMTLPIA